MNNDAGAKTRRFNFWFLFIAIWGVLFLHGLWWQIKHVEQLPYSRFLQGVETGKITRVAIAEKEIVGEMTQGTKQVPFVTAKLPEDRELASTLKRHKVEFTAVVEDHFFETLLSWIVPALIFMGIWFWLANRAEKHMNSMGGLMTIGKSKARVYVEEGTQVTFDDVAGVDEAKEELKEVVEFLKQPERFRRLGGRMPKGILLVGPPGTGKTLLAKAVAGEAGVPFFSISGSEFVELFVGVGAARVRDLFEQAQKKTPCIVFIDELDALGKARGSGFFDGSHDEKEQTLNQLLVEMDGFDPRQGIIILAATNRPEILDPALLRAGRFDRQVLVDRPDKKGRADILRVHLKKVVVEDSVNVDAIANLTTGFTGADLANVVNEAALLAARRNAERITMQDFSEAIERAVAGLQKKNRLLTNRERRTVAFHELGHALLASLLPGCDPVHKVSIIPRGISALGYTIQHPTEDRHLLTKEELRNKVMVLLGGRAAEDIVFNQLSTGAADDLAKATELARQMVTRFGMSEKLGFVSYEFEENTFLHKATPLVKDRAYSDVTAHLIDREIRTIIEMCYKEARTLLQQNQSLLEAAAQVLLTKETITAEELAQIIANHASSQSARAGAA